MRGVFRVFEYRTETCNLKVADHYDFGKYEIRDTRFQADKRIDVAVGGAVRASRQQTLILLVILSFVEKIEKYPVAEHGLNVQLFCLTDVCEELSFFDCRIYGTPGLNDLFRRD